MLIKLLITILLIILLIADIIIRYKIYKEKTQWPPRGRWKRIDGKCPDCLKDKCAAKEIGISHAELTKPTKDSLEKILNNL